MRQAAYTVQTELAIADQVVKDACPFRLGHAVIGGSQLHHLRNIGRGDLRAGSIAHHVDHILESGLIHRRADRVPYLQHQRPVIGFHCLAGIYINKVDHPNGTYDVHLIIDRLKAFRGHVIIQTMFMRGTTPILKDGSAEVIYESVDNTSDEYVVPWLEAVKAIAPQQVMIYTIDRETPTQGLLKATREQLDQIRDRVIAAGIPCTASY